MRTRPDLSSPEEILRLMDAFYGRVREDDLLRPIFVDRARVDWDEHLPKIAAFWCQLELGIRGFQGNPTQKHHFWSEQSPFRAEQFARWVELFHDTIDREWAGPHAESIKGRAVLIAKAQSRLVPSAEEWSGPKTT